MLLLSKKYSNQVKSYKTIAESIRSSLSDIKAEVIIGDLIDKGIDIDIILVEHESLFERNYSTDVSGAYIDMVRKLIVISIARNGLYDVLPEGLFHPFTRYNNLDAEDRKKEFQKQKQEEINARKFFMPLDNEFFVQRVNLELELLQLVRNPINILKKYFFNDQGIPDYFARKFMIFLPFTNEIKGDIELTAYSLSEILNEKVTHKSFYSVTRNIRNNLAGNSSNGNNVLGENFICGDYFEENLLNWEFLIILKDDSKFSNFTEMENNIGEKIIEKFFDFFIPVEIEVKTHILCESGLQLQLSNDNEQTEPILYLGYNISI